MTLVLRVVLSGFAAFASLAAFACGSEPTVGARSPVDEVAGTYLGVGLGDSIADIERKLGRPLGRAKDGFEIPFDRTDLGVPGYGPPYRGAPKAGPLEQLTLATAKFSGLRRIGAYAVVIIDPRAQTRRGVSIGDSLDEVRHAYPKAACGEQADNEDQDDYEYCTVGVATNRFVWFGGDPVQSITLHVCRFDGPDFRC